MPVLHSGYYVKRWHYRSRENEWEKVENTRQTNVTASTHTHSIYWIKYILLRCGCYVAFTNVNKMYIDIKLLRTIKKNKSKNVNPNDLPYFQMFVKYWKRISPEPKINDGLLLFYITNCTQLWNNVSVFCRLHKRIRHMFFSPIRHCFKCNISYSAFVLRKKPSFIIDAIFFCHHQMQITHKHGVYNLAGLP